MVMRITIRGQIFHKGGGDDAEHPTFIPMYTPTTLRAPRGHMTRPRAYAIGHKVNSILSKPSLSSRETWLLLQARTLCILRYQGFHREEAREQGELEAEDIREDGEEKRQGPDWPDDPANATEDYRSPPPEAGSSGPRPGSSGPCPDVRTASRTSGPTPPPAESLDHPGPHPDHPDQPGSSGFGPGSSGQRLCARVGLSPCTPSTS